MNAKPGAVQSEPHSDSFDSPNTAKFLVPDESFFLNHCCSPLKQLLLIMHILWKVSRVQKVKHLMIYKPTKIYTYVLGQRETFEHADNFPNTSFKVEQERKMRDWSLCSTLTKGSLANNFLPSSCRGWNKKRTDWGKGWLYPQSVWCWILCVYVCPSMCVCARDTTSPGRALTIRVCQRGVQCDSSLLRVFLVLPQSTKTSGKAG